MADGYRIGRREFDGFRRLIHDVSGISLGDNKDALLAARVGKRMRALGIESHGDYLEVIRSDETGQEICMLVDAISTNVTSFFREPQHFERLGSHLNELAEQGRTEIKMWSSACSTGEEPYSMGMVAADTVAASGVHVRLLATDISSEVLHKARAARFPATKTASVPHEYASRYLRPAFDDVVEVVPTVRQMVTFARINLSNPPFPMSGPFDAIMCRNVMIYFAKDTRERLVAELERLLAPGGLLMLGHAESLAGISTTLKPVQPAVYRRER